MDFVEYTENPEERVIFDFYKKVERTILSCKTEKQLEVSFKMLENYFTCFGYSESLITTFTDHRRYIIKRAGGFTPALKAK